MKNYIFLLLLSFMVPLISCKQTVEPEGPFYFTEDQSSAYSWQGLYSIAINDDWDTLSTNFIYNVGPLFETPAPFSPKEWRDQVKTLPGYRTVIMVNVDGDNLIRPTGKDALTITTRGTIYPCGGLLPVQGVFTEYDNRPNKIDFEIVGPTVGWNAFSSLVGINQYQDIGTCKVWGDSWVRINATK